MSIVFGIALCAFIGVIALVFEIGSVWLKVYELEGEIKFLRSLNESQEKYIDSLTRHIEQNTYNIRLLNELHDK